jgi:hypothetical protein
MQNPKAAERAIAPAPQPPFERRTPAHRTIYPTSIAAGIVAVKRMVHEVGKTGRNKFHNYSYATEADVLEALREPMNAAGLALIPTQVGEALQIRIPKEKGGGETIVTQITIEFTLMHESGDVWPVPLRFTGHGQDSQDKGPYKAMAGARKYAHIHLFGLTTTDDPERDGEQKPAPRQQSRPESPASPVRDAPSPQAAAADTARETPSQGQDRLTVTEFKKEWAKACETAEAAVCWDFWLAERQDLQAACTSEGEWAHLCKIVKAGMEAHGQPKEHASEGLPTWKERHGKS